MQYDKQNCNVLKIGGVCKKDARFLMLDDGTPTAYVVLKTRSLLDDGNMFFTVVFRGELAHTANMLCHKGESVYIEGQVDIKKPKDGADHFRLFGKKIELLSPLYA